MRYICFITLLLSTVGCSKQIDGRVPVSGQVTLEGRALAEGTIYFVPLDGQGSQGNTLLSPEGRFELKGIAGLQPGRYLVRISSADKQTTVNEEEAGSPGGLANATFFDVIPPEWNVASKQEVTVTAEGPNEFTFAIPNKLQSKKKL